MLKPELSVDLVLRMLGALALMVVAGVHFQQYTYAFYSTVPTIGSLFLLNFISAAALGLFLLLPARVFPAGLGRRLDQLAAVGGILVAAGSLAALLVSEHTPLFGFREYGYRPVIVLAIVSEAAAVAVLSLYLARSRGSGRPATGRPAAT